MTKLYVNEPEGTTSEILKRWADDVYVSIVLQDTLQFVFYDVEDRKWYSITEEVDYWKGYIWRYNNNMPSWKKIYEQD